MSWSSTGEYLAVYCTSNKEKIGEIKEIKIFSMKDRKEYIVKHEGYVIKIDWSPSDSFFLLFSKNTSGLYNIQGLLLSNIEN